MPKGICDAIGADTVNGSFGGCQNYGITWKVCIVEIERDIGGATRVRVHTVTTLARATPFFCNWWRRGKQLMRAAKLFNNGTVVYGN